MRKYKCIIQLHHHPHRTRAIRYISKKTAKKYGNVSNFIFEEFCETYLCEVVQRQYEKALSINNIRLLLGIIEEIQRPDRINLSLGRKREVSYR